MVKLDFVACKQQIHRPACTSMQPNQSVQSGRDITPCNKIDKPLVVYKYMNIRNDVDFYIV